MQYRKSFESVRLHNTLTNVGFMRELEFKFTNTPDVLFDQEGYVIQIT